MMIRQPPFHIRSDLWSAMCTLWPQSLP